LVGEKDQAARQREDVEDALATNSSLAENWSTPGIATKFKSRQLTSANLRTGKSR